MLDSTMLQAQWPNILAFFWFLICFKGYTNYTRRRAKDTPCLASVLHMARLEWMQSLLSREIRVADNTAIANLERSVSFFASTTMLVLAGLITILGSTEKALGLIDDLPFVAVATRAEWEIKLLILIAVFVYAFFKFTWSLRQYGFVSVMVGGAPVLDEKRQPKEFEAHSTRMARMGSMAAHNFNMGLRTYYFSIALLAWFITPWAFIAASTGIVFVLYRREFKSSTLKTLVFSQAGFDDSNKPTYL
jgi:uncharacterized membrane protein